MSANYIEMRPEELAAQLNAARCENDRLRAAVPYYVGYCISCVEVSEFYAPFDDWLAQHEAQSPEDAEAALWDEMARFASGMEADEGGKWERKAADRPWNQ